MLGTNHFLPAKFMAKWVDKSNEQYASIVGAICEVGKDDPILLVNKKETYTEIRKSSYNQRYVHCLML